MASFINCWHFKDILIEWSCQCVIVEVIQCSHYFRVKMAFSSKLHSFYCASVSRPFNVNIFKWITCSLAQLVTCLVINNWLLKALLTGNDVNYFLLDWLSLSWLQNLWLEALIWPNLKHSITLALEVGLVLLPIFPRPLVFNHKSLLLWSIMLFFFCSRWVNLFNGKIFPKSMWVTYLIIMTDMNNFQDRYFSDIYIESDGLNYLSCWYVHVCNICLSGNVILSLITTVFM